MSDHNPFDEPKLAHARAQELMVEPFFGIALMSLPLSVVMKDLTPIMNGDGGARKIHQET